MKMPPVILDKYERLNNYIAAVLPEEHQPLIEKILVIAAATVILVLSYYIVRFYFRKISNGLPDLIEQKITPVKVQDQELISNADLTKFLKGTLSILYKTSLLCLLAVYTIVVLGQFPDTRELPAQAARYFYTLLHDMVISIVEFLPNLIFILIASTVAYFLVRVVRVFFNGIKYERVTLKGFYKEWADPTFSLVRGLIIVFLLVIIFPYLPGFNSPALQGLTIFVGVLVSLGSTAVITNIVSGIAITYMRAFKNGDRVKIADTVGDVMERSLFVTRIKTPKNVEIAIPNSMIMNNHIINFSTLAKTEGVILPLSITIGYDVPWRDVHQLMIDAALTLPLVEMSPEPFVLQKALDDYYVHYELNVYTKTPEKTPGIYSELHEAIQDKFNEAGIEIASPHFSAIRDGNALNIPEEYLPKNYNAGGFRFGFGGGKIITKAAGLGQKNAID